MALELTDPKTGQIKTSYIVIGGVGVLGVLLLLGSKSGGGQSGVVANGQSSGISDQLGALSGAIAGLAAQDNAAGAGTTGGGTSGSGSGTGATGGTNTGTGSTNTGGTTNTPTGQLPAGLGSWLTDLVSRVGSAHRSNPTNPISPTTFTPGSAFANLPGGIITGQLEGLIGSGDNAAYHNFISQYTGVINAISPQNPSAVDTPAGDKITQLLNDIKTGNFQDIGNDRADAIHPIPGGPVNGTGTVGSPNQGNFVPPSLFTTVPGLPSLPNASGQYQSFIQNLAAFRQPNVQPIVPTLPSTNYSSYVTNLLGQYRTASTQPVP